MIHYVKGNLLESDAEALVNTVNTVGVMGKGIALQFREAFPVNYHLYRNACRNGEVHVGEMFITEDANLIYGRKLIINFPTKTDWHLPSEYLYIQDGLQSLRTAIIERGIKSIAIPPLGSHNGGLDWIRVMRMEENALSDLDCDIYLYEPSEVIVERMNSERVKLTPSRAMLLVMLGDMIRHGEFASVFAAEKLVYFMQRFGGKEYFKIDFRPYYYGPYSGGKISHVLYRLNGNYIKGMGGMQNHPFDYIWLMDGAEQAANLYIDSNEDSRLQSICDRTKSFLEDYYSNYSLELLSSVDYLLNTVPALKDWQEKEEGKVLDILEKEMQLWSKRKEQLFKRNYLNEAFHYLKEQSDLMA